MPNGIDANAKLKLGQKITVPAKSAAVPAAAQPAVAAAQPATVAAPPTKMAAAEPGYSAVSIASHLHASVSETALRFTGHSASTASGVISGEALAWRLR